MVNYITPTIPSFIQFSFIFFIVYFQRDRIQRRRHQPLRADIFRCAVCHCHFQTKSQLS